MRDWVRNLLENEAISSKSSVQPEPPTIAVFEKLRRQLTASVGAAGFQALAYRALTLARVEVPLLIDWQITKDGSLRGFNELEPQMENKRAGIVLISQLLGQFQTFLGATTTQRLVQDIFPVIDTTIESDDSASATPEPFEGIFQEAGNLRMVSESLELLASQHPDVETGLATISRNIRNTAILLEVFAAVRNASDALREGNPTQQLTDYVM